MKQYTKHQHRLSIAHVMGYETDASLSEQCAVLAHAIETFIERNEEYTDLWKDGGTADSLHHMRHKLMRCERAKSPSVKAESAIDLINYAVFFIRNLEREAMGSPE